ncbi:hypothetical protein Sm713_30920 [Streptomyces sp. TS71-3]|nr:hypothetical protein Sm713_30920 [Streptomyces sp. TS71-3]
MRMSEPATLLCATIRMVCSSKAGPAVVMLGDQALTRVPWAGCAAALVAAACAVPGGTTTADTAAARAQAAVSRRALRRAPRGAAWPLFWWDIVVLHSSRRAQRTAPAAQG